jgi:hypothetical protein
VTSDFIESSAGKEVAGTKRIAERGFFHFLASCRRPKTALTEIDHLASSIDRDVDSISLISSGQKN